MWLCTRVLVEWRDLVLKLENSLFWYASKRIQQPFFVCLFPLLLLPFIHFKRNNERPSFSQWWWWWWSSSWLLLFGARWFRIGKTLVGKLPFCFDIIISPASIPFAFAYFYYFSPAFFFSICCFVLQQIREWIARFNLNAKYHGTFVSIAIHPLESNSIKFCNKKIYILLCRCWFIFSSMYFTHSSQLLSHSVCEWTENNNKKKTNNQF